MDGDLAVIGTPFAYSDSGSNTGTAYMFHLDANNQWVEHQKLIPSDQRAYDAFGVDIAIGDGYAFIGTAGKTDTVCGCITGNVFENTFPISMVDEIDRRVLFYPNPVRINQPVKIDLGKHSKLLLEIFDLSGKHIYDRLIPFPATPLSLQLPFSEAGIYLYRLKTDNQAMHQGKIIGGTEGKASQGTVAHRL